MCTVSRRYSTSPAVSYTHLAAQLQNLQTAYKELVQTAVSCLKEAKGAADRFDAALPQPDPAAMEQVKANLLAQLFSP